MLDQRMSKKMMKALKDAVGKLSERYEFNRDEGEKLLGLNEKKKKVGKPCVALPWTGEVCDDWCKGVRPSHGLYSQCTNARMKEEEYCKTCKKNDDMPTVDNRDEWMSSNGKKTKHYGTYLIKKDISREEADREALRFGLTIPESAYEAKGSSRGRPRKTAATSDTDESEDDSPKKRGRPRNVSNTTDMFAELLAENRAAELAAAKEIDGVANNEDTELKAEREATLKAAREATLKAEREATLKAEREAKKAERDAKKAERDTKKAERDAKKAENAKMVEEKAKLTEIRKAEREERRNKKEAKKKVETFGATTDDEEDNQECKKDEEKKIREDELQEEEYGEEVCVKSWENNGVKYLLNKKTGDVYDKKTKEHIGIWNGEEIQEVESSSDTDGEE